jgi:hypothetical protein
MKPHLFATVAGAVRAWVWLYTLPLDPAERENRRHEIASDIWELEADSGPTFSTTVHVLVRAILGVPDDLLWIGERISADHAFRPLAIARVAMCLLGIATAAVSASGPRLDPAQALKVDVQSVGWVRVGSDARNSDSEDAPAIAFTITNVGDLPTRAVDVNAMFYRPRKEGYPIGFGTAFARVVGWRGLDARVTSARVLLHGQPLHEIDTVSARPAAPPADCVDELDVRLFVRHRGRWTLVGNFRVSAQGSAERLLAS